MHRHLCKDAADRPHIDRGRVVARTKEDLGGTVPKCYDLDVVGEKFLDN